MATILIWWSIGMGKNLLLSWNSKCKTEKEPVIVIILSLLMFDNLS
jgi:hypothetical protein